MNLKKLINLLIVASLLFASINQSIACTVLIIRDANGLTYQGRTNEFSSMQPDSLSYFPAGTKIESVTPDGKVGLTFNTKYAILGATLHGMTANAKQDVLHEAVNDQGMTFTINAFAGTTSPQIESGASNVLSVVDVGSWALGNFQNVAQVKQALNNKEVSIWLPRIPSMGNQIAPIHFALFDKSGAGIVMEFINGQVLVYDNPVGVMTNNPGFPWHLDNLNNYANLSNVDKNSGHFNGLKVNAYDSGNALANVPSTQISSGRFVKAAFYSTYVERAKNPKVAIQTLAHVMNNFDRPYNLSIDLAGTGSKAESDPSSRTSTSEVTYFTVLNDLSQNQFYIRTINAMNYSRFDIRKLDSVKQVKKISFDRINATDGGDSTYLFLN